MTPQEEQLLEGLIQRVQQTQLQGKDQQAEQRLAETLGQDPDALYILCQTVLVQQYALDQAQKQLADTRQQLELARQQPQQHTSFLGGLFGGGQQSAPPPPPTQYAPVYGGGQPVYVAPQYVPVPGGFMGGGFGGGGFLQGAMQTAAGVVAGEMAFRGIEDLMHGFGREAGYGSDRDLGFGGGYGGQPEIINNYYGDDRGDHSGGDHQGGDFGDRLQAADGSSGISPDIEDRRDDFVDSSADTSSDQGDDQGFVDNSQDDFTSSDDGGGDFGSSDDGGF